MAISPAAEVVRFGLFELAVKDGELRKNGMKIRLGQQPMQVLAVLVERAGEVVTREELRRKLWPEDVFVDFDHGLNKSIQKLRDALGDSAESPRYIETIPRTGYRFIAPVQVVAREDEPERDTVVLDGGTGLTGGIATSAPARRRKRVLAGVAVAIAAVGGLWYFSRPSTVLHVSSYTQITHDGHTKGLRGTDGSRLYIEFVSPYSLAQIGISGGEMAPLPTAVPGRQVDLLDVSPVGGDLLMLSFPVDSEVHTLWMERILGGSTRRLAEGNNGAFSPDAKAVVYVKANGDIDIVSADGAESRHLASPGFVTKWPGWSPGWSPDGKLIRFHKDGRLWEMSSSGDNLHPLLPDWHVPGYQTGGRWSPDGKLYFFLLSAGEYEGGQIWAIDEGRRLPWQKPAQPVQLTNGPIHWHAPVPGRDGKTVFAVGDTRRGELSRFDQKTGRLAPFLGGISAEYVSFSRDGKFVAYVSYPDGILWRANGDGSNRIQLTTPPMYPVNPQWSPDGSQIAFGDLNNREKFAVYVVDTDGEKNPQKLLSQSQGFEMDPGWSPDGQKVVFAESLPADNREEISILDLASHRVSAIPGSNGMYSPRWSPNGRFIAALGRKAPFLRIFDVEGQQWSVLPTTGIVGFPCFSSDSQTIYFLRYGFDQGIFRIGISGGKEERVLDMKDLHLTGFSMVSLSLDLTDAPLVLRDAGTHDVYALSLERARN